MLSMSVFLAVLSLVATVSFRVESFIARRKNKGRVTVRAPIRGMSGKLEKEKRVIIG